MKLPFRSKAVDPEKASFDLYWFEKKMENQES